MFSKLRDNNQLVQPQTLKACSRGFHIIWVSVSQTGLHTKTRRRKSMRPWLCRHFLITSLHGPALCTNTHRPEDLLDHLLQCKRISPGAQKAFIWRESPLFSEPLEWGLHASNAIAGLRHARLVKANWRLRACSSDYRHQVDWQETSP